MKARTLSLTNDGEKKLAVRFARLSDLFGYKRIGTLLLRMCRDS
jgi:hypothetical protein